MGTKVSPKHQRSMLVKKCILLKYSAEMILELLDRVNAYPEEEREAAAARILTELEE